jgi:molybdenum cofactor guanylyltransferase
MGLSAAVLTGGQSRRMGTDKALLPVGGTPLVQRVLEVVAAVAEDVQIVGDRPAYHQFGVPVVADRFPDAGALGGIATAIEAARCERVLVVACDMPLISRRLLRAMADEPQDYDVLVPVTAAERSQQGGDVTYETLHAIYTRACLDAIRSSLAQGRRRVVGFFPSVTVRQLPEGWVRQYDPDLRSFLNANNPAELEYALTLIDREVIEGDRA